MILTQTIGIPLFAQKAEAEGYAQVAKLFRAAAQSEAIHREPHKSAIISLGGKADEINLDEVRTERRLGLFIAFATSINEVNGD